tara:strand:- start:750 stop:1139 length:390 start_codon:yes stop_codon:yes gene_type:complete
MEIPGVLILDREGHEDDRRALMISHNGDFPDFGSAAQVKILHTKKDCQLAGHYHNYGEIFLIALGSASFSLKDLDSNKTGKVVLRIGQRIYIPPRVAHKVTVPENSILVGSTEEQYVSPEYNDQPYDLE